jgi:hypothetical protein
MKGHLIYYTRNMDLHRKTLYNMKIAGLVFSLLITIAAAAQDEATLKKIESARIALITERLGLTPDQAEKFWPVYKEYTQQRQQLREEYRSLRTSTEGQQISDEESKKLLDKGLKLKEKQLNLDKSYNDRLGRVITNNQLLQLRRAEEDFKKMILQRLDNRKEQRERINRREERKKNEQ